VRITELLELTIKRGASDLHLKTGGVPVLRVDGELLPQTELGAVDAATMATYLAELTTPPQLESFNTRLELDFAYGLGERGQFRVNAYRQRGTLSLACRTIQTHIPTIAELGLPQICEKLAGLRHGLVLITAPTGGGKSTTLAAMMEFLNQTKKRNIFTIEDPIEYLHKDNLCIFSQREVGSDTTGFATALKYVLRQDPDVILVGEMRDLETMRSVLTLAETGHLVLTTLHTPGAATAIDRFIDVFPANQQQQVRVQLAMALEGVLFQSLLPAASGEGRVAAMEILTGTTAVRNLIRENKTYQLASMMQTGAEFGMQTFNQALAKLYRGGLVSREETFSYSPDVKELKALLSDR
jgi:twitching motility protein PilT